MASIVSPITLTKGLNATFVKAFNSMEDPADVMPFMTITNSSSNQEDYGWLGQSPQMVQWIDERRLQALNDFSYSIPNLDYEATLSVNRNDIEDDQLGNVGIRINELARRARVHPRKLFFETLVAGTTELCYDGVAFFSNSHEEGESGTQDNLLAGVGTTLANLQADFEAAEAAMLSFLDDQGEPMNEGELKLAVICPVGLKEKFRQLNTLSMINNSENGMKGRIEKLVSSARLTDANDWYVANISEGVKGIIMQKRKDPKFESLEGDSDNGFMRKVYHYGVDYRVGFGYGLWQKMVKVVNS